MTPGPFSAAADLEQASLRPLAQDACAGMAQAIVAMPPLSVMSYPADAMARYLASADDGARRYAIEVNGKAAGAMSVRYPWLKGPYLELLALLPAFQGQGIGARLLHWFEQEALKRDARNLWVCASHFNERAVRCYARHGFEPATLPGLVADGFDEILLRKGPLKDAAGGDRPAPA